MPVKTLFLVSVVALAGPPLARAELVAEDRDAAISLVALSGRDAQARLSVRWTAANRKCESGVADPGGAPRWKPAPAEACRKLLDAVRGQAAELARQDLSRAPAAEKLGYPLLYGDRSELLEIGVGRWVADSLPLGYCEPISFGRHAKQHCETPQKTAPTRIADLIKTLFLQPIR